MPYKGEVLDLKQEISDVIEASGLSLFECSKTETDAQEFVNSRLTYLHQWLKHFAVAEGTSAIISSKLKEGDVIRSTERNSCDGGFGY